MKTFKNETQKFYSGGFVRGFLSWGFFVQGGFVGGLCPGLFVLEPGKSIQYK